MKIAVLDDYAGVALTLADWSGLGDVTVFRDTLADPAAIVARLAPFEVVCVMRERTPLPAAIIEALPALRLIVTTGPHNASIDLESARRCGVTVCGTEAMGGTTAELALALMLVLSRRIVTEQHSLVAGDWQSGLGRGLGGKSLGLIGLGRIGGAVCDLARAFGMEIAAWSPNLTDERCAARGVDRARTLEELMARSDVVSLHMALSERTRGLVGAGAFAAMRDGAIFVNTSRAGLVDTAALLSGLRAGRPAMAGIDVFDREPLPADDPVVARDLIAEGRLLLTPHLGYATHETFRLFYGQTVEAVRAWAAGRPIRILNPA